MKLSLIAIAALACSAGVTPVAFAQDSQTTTAALSLSNGLQPVTEVRARYPYWEQRSQAEGVCTVTFDVSAAGVPTNVRAESCSSRHFEREALRVAENLRYPAEALPAEGLTDQSFTIRWEGESG